MTFNQAKIGKILVRRVEVLEKANKHLSARVAGRHVFSLLRRGDPLTTDALLASMIAEAESGVMPDEGRDALKWTIEEVRRVTACP